MGRRDAMASDITKTTSTEAGIPDRYYKFAIVREMMSSGQVKIKWKPKEMYQNTFIRNKLSARLQS